MNWQEVIAALKKIEGASGLADELQIEYQRVVDDRYKIIGDQQERGRKITELQNTLDAVMESAGVDGENLTAKATALTAKLKKLTDERDRLNTQLAEERTAKQALEATKQESDRLLNAERRRVQIRDAAAAARANPMVLETILSLEDNRELGLEVAAQEDGTRQVLVVRGEEKKPLRDFAQATLPDFLPSLFPVETAPPPTTPAPRETRLPSGTPNSKTQDKPSLTSTVLKAAGFNGLPE